MQSPAPNPKHHSRHLACRLLEKIQQPQLSPFSYLPFRVPSVNEPRPYQMSHENRNETLVEVKRNGHSLRHASEALKNDREIVLAAVNQTSDALLYASDALKNDREIVLAALEKNPPGALEYASDELKDDREIVLKAVTRQPTALRYASAELKNDREIVRMAIQKDPHCLRFAGGSMKKDSDIVKMAVSEDGESLRWADPSLRVRRDVVTVAVTAKRQSKFGLQFADERLQGDRAIVEAAVKRNGDALQYASDELREDLSVALHAVRQNGRALAWAKGGLRENHDLELEALRQLHKSRRGDPNQIEMGNDWHLHMIQRQWSLDGYSRAVVPRDEKKYMAAMDVAVENRIATSLSEGLLACVVLKTNVSEDDSLTVTASVGFSATKEFPGLSKETTIEELAGRVLQDYPTAQYVRLLAVHGTTAVPVLPENGRSLVTALVPPKSSETAVRRPSRRTSRSRSRSPFSRRSGGARAEAPSLPRSQ